MDRDFPHQTLANVVLSRFFLDIYTGKSFRLFEDIFFNMDPSIVSQYGYPQRVRALLANQKFNSLSDIHIQKFLQVNGPRFEVNDATKMFYVTSQWEAFI